MAQKELKPVLTGQRIKSRKRDKQEKFDKEGFRDDIIEGILGVDDIEGASAFIETSERTGDYRMYEAQLFDILVAGGLLAPGGTIEADGAELNPYSCFQTEDSHDALFKQAGIIQRLVRRYKFLQPSLEENFEKFGKCLNGFEEENIPKLAQCAAFLMSMSMISAKPLMGMVIESIVESGLARSFITTFFKAFLKVSSIQQIGGILRKGGLDQKLDVFFPQNERTVENIVSHLTAAGGLEDLVTWFMGQQTAEVKKQLHFDVRGMIKNEVAQDAIIEKVRAVQVENRIPESQIIKILWSAMMEAIEWNKKAELMVEQACRHIHSNLKLLARWSRSDRAQIVLLVAMQEYSFVNQNLIKSFKRIVLLFYKAEVVGEDAIEAWYTTDHSQKGKSAFLAEMEEMVQWLNSAEVEE